MAGLFGQVLALCARTGLLRPGLIAIDGTKLTANPSRDANRTAAQIATRMTPPLVPSDSGVARSPTPHRSPDHEILR